MLEAMEIRFSKCDFKVCIFVWSICQWDGSYAELNIPSTEINGFRFTIGYTKKKWDLVQHDHGVSGI